MLCIRLSHGFTDFYERVASEGFYDGLGFRVSVLLRAVGFQWLASARLLGFRGWDVGLWQKRRLRSWKVLEVSSWFWLVFGVFVEQ